MKDEREKSTKLPLTLHKVAESAKEILLAEGKYAPMLLVEGSKQTLAIDLEELPESMTKRARQLIVAGFAVARDYNLGELQQAFFVSEGWMSLPDEGIMLDVPPSQDPNRREVLMISHLKMPDFQMAANIIELLRDGNGILRELRDYRPPMGGEESIFNPLLLAFAAGYQAGTKGTFDLPHEPLG